jgi:surfeit locus 1 family protein
MRRAARYPGWVPTCAAILGLALTLSAAYWQFGRARDKAALRQQYQVRQAMPPYDLRTGVPTPEAVSFRKVQVTGRFVSDKAILLDNRLRAGAAGYEIVVPLQISGSHRHILVNRGWVARGRERSDLPVISVPENVVTIFGTAIVPGPGALELSDETVEGRVWQNLNLARYRERQKLDILDFVVNEESVQDDGLDRKRAEPGFGIRTHQSYAAQWLLFAALIIFFYVYYGFFRKKSGNEK